MQNFLFNMIGLTGSLILIYCYFLLQTDKISSEDVNYSICNAIGSGLIIVSLIEKWNLPSFFIEAFWLLISLYGVYKYK